MNSFRNISFLTLAGPEPAELAPGSMEIVVTPKNPLPEYCGQDDLYLCAEFANWPSDANQVLRFTRQYGSLGPFREDNEQYVFSIADWRTSQQKLRRLWEVSVDAAERLGNRNRDFGIETFKVETGEDFFWTREKLVYRTKSLFRFIWIEFHCIPLDRLRKCADKDCKTPYFVAPHLGQRYCSDLCARSAQREAKKNWWQNCGTAWRHNRIKKQKRARKSGGRR